jgi:homoserine kinase
VSPDGGDTALAVRVPASTSNLGTGFDALGLALDLWLDVRLAAAPPAGTEHVVAAGGPEGGRWPAPREDRLLAAFDRAREVLGLPAEPRAFVVETEIPLARGLGSSGSATAAGILLAAALADEPLDPAGLLALGVELEGHPDNVAPSLSGGCTLCLPVAGAVRALPVDVHPDLAFAVAWPEAAVRTAEARAVLPDAVPFADAVENARRLPFLLEGLRRGDPELLALGGEDRLHERHRLPLVPGAAGALEAGRCAGAHLTVLSGSGSALLGVTSHGSAPAVAEAMAEALRRGAGSGTGRVVRPALEAPSVRAVREVG